MQFIHTDCMAARKGELSLLRPAADKFSADRLEYPDLEESVRKYYWDEYTQLGDGVDMSNPETALIDTSAMSARHLALIALKLQQAESRNEHVSWTNAFTDLSVNLYGRPDETEALAIIKKDLTTFEEAAQPRHGFSSRAVGKMLDVYRAASEKAPDSLASLHDDDEILLGAVDDYLESKYGHVYEIFSDVDRYDVIDVNEIYRRFELALSILARDDPGWAEWKLVMTDSAQMAVSPGKQEIRIGRKLPDLPVHRVIGLMSHEIFRHAGSGVAGRKYSRELGVGLPGNKKAEEGAGIIYEGAKDGKMPYRAGDRYVDIALGLGLADQPPLSRPEMFPLVYGRTILRRTADGAPIDDKMIEDISWQHVTRIYRGTLGNDVVGVLTYDTRYYDGFRDEAYRLKQFPLRYLPYVLDFSSSGKIDPSRAEQRRYLDDYKNGHVRQIWPSRK